MLDVVLESARALVLLCLLLFLVHVGRTRFTTANPDWNWIVGGFSLLLFGSLIDITDNFETLNRFVVIGDTETEAFLEKVVGFLGGFVAVTIGLVRWIPKQLTEREQAEELLRAAIEGIPEGFAFYDADDRLAVVNSKMAKTYPLISDLFVPGTTFEEVLRIGIERGQFTEAKGREEEFLQEILDYHRDPKGAVEYDLPDGRYIRVEEKRVPSGGVVGIRTDITELKQAEEALRRNEERLERLATTDPLTGANNRRSFFEQGEKELHRARRHKRPLSLMMVDIDHFKRVNDTHGHAIGDEVLKRLVSKCNDTLRTQDILGRFGGEEFAAVLPEVGLASATKAAERLRRALEDLEVETSEGTLKFTVSIGVSECRYDDESLETALARADKALYSAKESGRNRVVAEAI